MKTLMLITTMILAGSIIVWYFGFKQPRKAAEKRKQEEEEFSKTITPLPQMWERYDRCPQQTKQRIDKLVESYQYRKRAIIASWKRDQSLQGSMFLSVPSSFALADIDRVVNFRKEIEQIVLEIETLLNT